MNAKRRKSLKEIFEQVSELKNQLENLNSSYTRIISTYAIYRYKIYTI